MIVLKNISKYIECEAVFFTAIVDIDGKEEELWYSTAVGNQDYIATTNGDAFILMLFIYSVFKGKSFTTNVPISAKLKFGLLHVLLPAFQKMSFKVSSEQFEFKELDYSIFGEADACGTAMSFGVDSFYTLTSVEDTENAVDTLTLFNAGAFGQYGGDKARGLFERMKERVEQFAQKNNKNFIWVDTNINEVLPLKFVQTHTFRNFACALVFQKYFKKYYYASGLTLDSFKLNIMDPAYYDLLNSKALSNNTIEFVISGLVATRFDKTIFIANQPITYNELNVCLVTPDNANVAAELSRLDNCSKCVKCIRTMVTLDVAGKLPLYSQVFDLGIYKNNKLKYFGEMLYLKYVNRNVFAVEILHEAQKHNYKIPFNAFFYALSKAFNSLIKKF